MAVDACALNLTHKALAHGRYKVRSLMQALQLKAKRLKQHRYPIAGKPSQIAPNSLNRQFNPTIPTRIGLAILPTFALIKAGYI